jgi:hypothetical protein
MSSASETNSLSALVGALEEALLVAFAGALPGPRVEALEGASEDAFGGESGPALGLLRRAANG